MNENIYKITLSDGTTISDLTLNGSNFISKTPVYSSTFEDNCSTVIINDGKTEREYHNMELVQITEQNGEWWFVLRELSKEELEKIKTQSDIEYIAMMTGIEL